MANVNFTKEMIEEQVRKFSKKAEAALRDEGKLRGIIEKAKVWIKKGSKIPVIGGVIDDLATMIDLLTDYVDGTYRDIPMGILITIVAAVLYVISPFDLIGDLIPITGWMDDIAVVTLVMKAGAAPELAKYKAWKAQMQEEAEVATAMTKLKELFDGLDEEEMVLAVFAIDNSRLELLSTVVPDLRKPIPCRAQYMIIKDTELKGRPVLDVYNRALDRMEVRWSAMGRIGIRYAQDYETYTEDFNVLG